MATGDRTDKERRQEDATIAAPVPERTMLQGLSGLTRKQCDVLDLLIQHKTSKQISRELGISPFTVDQRLNAARDKLGLATRIDLAHYYRGALGPSAGAAAVTAPTLVAPAVPNWNGPVSGDHSADSTAFYPQTVPVSLGESISQTVVYRPFGMAFAGPRPDSRQREDGVRNPTGSQASYGTAPADYHHVLPEMFDGPNGTVLRLGAMLFVTLALMVMALAGMAMFSQLGALLDH